MKKDQEIHQRYMDDAAEERATLSAATAAYRYLDVGLIIEQCFKVFDGI